MVQEGSLIRVFKLKCDDDYHNIGEYKYGKVIKEYPNFFLVRMQGNYNECFKGYEMEEVSGYDNQDNQPREECNVRLDV